MENGCGPRNRTARFPGYGPDEPPLLHARDPFELAAAARVELASTRLQDECSGYPIELRRKVFGGLRGSQTLTRSLQDFYAVSYITSPN